MLELDDTLVTVVNIQRDTESEQPSPLVFSSVASVLAMVVSVLAVVVVSVTAAVVVKLLVVA